MLPHEMVYSLAKKGDVNGIMSLIKRGVDINKKDKNQKTALHYAVQYGRLDATKRLLENGAMYNIKDGDGKTPSKYARTCTLECLFTSVEIFFKEVKIGNEKEVFKLLNKKFVDCKEEADVCFIQHWTVYEEYLEKIKEFKDIKNENNEVSNPLNKIIINTNEKGGHLALHYAIYNKHENIVSLLLKSGANATNVIRKGYTPLHFAVSEGKEETVRILLDHVLNTGGNLFDYMNVKSKSGFSALHLACMNGYFNIVITLLRHGAVYNIEDNAGQIPLDLSTNKNVTDLLQLIGALFEDAKNGDEQIHQTLKLVGCFSSSYINILISALNEDGKNITELAIGSNN